MIASSTTADPPIDGVQLQRQGHKCGWIRIYDASAITSLLEEGERVGCLVLETEEFIWHGETCYWGKVRWYALRAGLRGLHTNN